MAGCACQITDLTVPQGPQGLQGDPGGNTLEWEFSTGGVSNGKLRTNGANTDLSLVTQFNVNEVDPDGTNVAAWLNTIASTDRVKIWKRSDNSIFGVYTVGAVSSSGGERLIPVTLIDSNGSLANGDEVAFSHALTGSTGATGSNGTNGTSVIEIDFTAYTLNGVGYAQFLTPTTIAANTFSTVDDTIKVEGFILTDINDGARTADYKIELIENANTITLIDTVTDSNYFLPQLHGAKFELYATMTDSNEITVYREIGSITNSNATTYASRADLNVSNEAVSLTAAQSPYVFSNAGTLKFSGKVDNAADEIKLGYFKITKLTK